MEGELEKGRGSELFLYRGAGGKKQLGLNGHIRNFQ